MSFCCEEESPDVSLLLQNISLPLVHFTLEVNADLRGRVTAIFGPSGAGKTSLLDLIAGLRGASSAFIQLDNEVLTDTTKRLFVAANRRGIGYVPQDLALFPHLSVRQNLLYGRKSGPGTSSTFTLDHVAEVLEIKPLIDRTATELSGGERQRVALARALISAPRLLLLDEPLASLDAPLKAKIIPFLTRIRDEFKIPTLCVTHDRFEALALADEIVVLINGKVRQAGPVLDVFNQPTDGEVARIVGVETQQPGIITSRSEELVTVQIGNTVLTALAPSADIREVFVCIRGEDVIVQRDSRSVSSVRNRLSARVVSVQPGSPMVRVELDAGFSLFALVTRPACEELALHPGAVVTALIKAPAIHLVPR